MNKILKNIGFFIVLMALTWPLTFPAAWVYRWLFESNATDGFFDIAGGSFWGPSSSIVAGLLMSLMFMIAIYLITSFKRKVAIISIIIINIVIVSGLISLRAENVQILVFSSILGWLLGEGILWSYNKLKK